MTAIVSLPVRLRCEPVRALVSEGSGDAWRLGRRLTHTAAAAQQPLFLRSDSRPNTSQAEQTAQTAPVAISSHLCVFTAVTMFLSLVLLLSLLALATAAAPELRHLHRRTPSPIAADVERVSSSPASSAVSLSIDASKPLVSVSPDLYGIFFEEINHSGTGGLWAQQIWNSNFEDTRGLVEPWSAIDTGAVYQLVLDEEQPINGINPVSLQVVTDQSADTAGISNTGYWGINVTDGLVFDGSLHVRSRSIRSITVSLVDAATGSQTFASATIDGVTAMWHKFNYTLTCKGGAGTAVFRITWKTVSKEDRINFDVVTLFPRLGWRGLPWMRPDLAEAVAALHPSFMRFPGGCYVEGQILANRFNWKRSLGPLEYRAGHWNLWGYWSEDGMGLFEFLQFIERLTDAYGEPTRAIWVVNNGNSHEESLPPSVLAPYVQDALDSIEFAQGPADSYWGARRAAMGHPEPFHIDYVAIGNEDCGKDSYAADYALFYNALSAAYPMVKLISNCDPADKSMQGLPTQLWDYHIYTSAEELFRGRNTFDDPRWRTASSAKIFNSESERSRYAVTSGAGMGNARAAVAEAAWMNGLERNSDLVTTASYAPLFVNVMYPAWLPDAIVFNASQSFGTPSYHNQLMYANSFSGCQSGTVQTLAYTLSDAANVSVAVALCTLSAAEQSRRASNVVLVHKLVNFASTPASLSIAITNLPPSAQLNTTLEVVFMRSDDALLENTFEQPRAVVPVMTTIKVDGPSFSTALPPWSVFVVRAYAAV